MPLLSQIVGPLVGGVSQAPPHLRSPEYSGDQLNALAHPALGLTKRPGTRHVARLGDAATFAGASIFPFTAGDERRYFLVVRSGSLRVIEADTGTERVVTMAPGASAYLAAGAGEARPFDAVAAGDTLYLVNRTRVVQKGSAMAPARPIEALVTVAAADYGTRYTLALNGMTVVYETPDGTSPAARADIATDHIAAQLAEKLSKLPSAAQYLIDRHGSTLYIRRHDGAAFGLTAGDGLADGGLRVLMGAARSADLLPPTGVVEGITIEVGGDPRSQADNYWMAWKDGQWQEAPRPGSLTELDASSLPHQLVLGGAIRDGIQVQAAAPAPSVTSREREVTVPLTSTGNGAQTVDYVTTLMPNAWAEGVVADAAVFNSIVSFRFDVDASGLTPGTALHVPLIVNGVEVLTRVFRRGHGYQTGVALTGDVSSLTSGATVRVAPYEVVETEYTPDPESPDQIYPAIVSFRPATALTYTQPAVATVSFPDVVYPDGATISLTVNGATSTVTTSGGTTGAQLAGTFASALSGSNGGSGIITFYGSAVPPTVSFTVAANDTQQVAVPGGGLVPGSLVGLLLQNTSTGAAGTVTANTDRLITVNGLSGGSSNKFRPGDLCKVVSAPDSFSFAPVAWEPRQAGDDSSNPFPSIVGRPISNISVAQNRLLLTAGEYIVLSAAAKLTRLFRSTAQTVLDSDMIDIRGVSNRGLPFRHAVNWNEDVHFLNDRALQRLSGAPALTPRTVSLDHLYEVTSSETCRPAIVGRRLYIARSQNDCTQLLALVALESGAGVDSADVTREVPTYLKGRPVFLAADAGGLLILVTEVGTERSIYAMQEVQAGRTAIPAWTRWTFDAGARVLAASMEGGDVALVIERADGAYLETLDTLAHA